MYTYKSELKSFQGSSSTVSKSCLLKVHAHRLNRSVVPLSLNLVQGAAMAVLSNNTLSCNRMSRLSKEVIKKAKVGKLKMEIMEMENLKLYMKNKRIFEDNQRLQKEALFLQQENKDLLSQIQKIYNSHNSSKIN